MQLTDVEQAILKNMHDLPLAEQQSLLDFSLFLKYKVQSEENPQEIEKERKEREKLACKIETDKSQHLADTHRKVESQTNHTQIVNFLLGSFLIIIITWSVITIPSFKINLGNFSSSKPMSQQELQVAEALGLLVGLKTPTEEWFWTKGTWPTNLEQQLGSRIKGKYTSYISINGMGYKAILKDPNITGEVRLDFNSTQKIWTCANSTVSQDYLPTACKK